MSETGAGTDVLGLTSTAKKQVSLLCHMCVSPNALARPSLTLFASAWQGDGSYILNGGKMWITNGAVNDTVIDRSTECFVP